jgi:hypothetical protein
MKIEEMTIQCRCHEYVHVRVHTPHHSRITSCQFDTFSSSNLKSDCTNGFAVSKLVWPTIHYSPFWSLWMKIEGRRNLSPTIHIHADPPILLFHRHNLQPLSRPHQASQCQNPIPSNKAASLEQILTRLQIDKYNDTFSLLFS